jgi:hypothetical protein
LSEEKEVVNNLEGINQFVNPPTGYKGVNRWVNWHGFRCEMGSGYGTVFLDDVESRRNSIEATIIVVTGGGGTGKTYFVLRLAEILDPKFDVDLQVPFGAEELMNLIGPDSPLKMGQVIILDESQYGASSRDWYSEIQKDLMKQLEAIRSKGLIIFIVALNEATLDLIVRGYVLTHKIHMMSRGHGRVYKYNLGPFSKSPYPKTLSKDEHMLLPSAEKCEHSTCLTCQYSGLSKRMWRSRKTWEKRGVQVCQIIRAKYERKKKNFLEEQVRLSIEKREEKTAKKMKIEIIDIVNVLKEHSTELRKTVRNKVDSGSALVVARKTFPEVTENKVISACRELVLIPDFIEKLQGDVKK